MQATQIEYLVTLYGCRFPIFWGITVAFISCIGCCGIKFYSRILLAIYIILVIVVFVIQLTVAIVFVTEHQEDLMGLKSQGTQKLKDLVSQSVRASSSVCAHRY